jgi:hypothetical protein
MGPLRQNYLSSNFAEIYRSDGARYAAALASYNWYITLQLLTHG